MRHLGCVTSSPHFSRQNEWADTAVRPYKQSPFNAGRPNAREKSVLATFRRKKEKLRGAWVQSANFASGCTRKLLIL